VRYQIAREGDSGLMDGTADLVTAAQAFHWFDAPAFFRESQRVLRVGGVVAVWCYGLHELGADLDPSIAHFYERVVGEDWPPQRALVESGYRDVEFPFDELPAPRFTIVRQLDLPALLRYIETWSAVQRHRQRTGHDPLPALREELLDPWGDPVRQRRVAWPIAMRAGRVHSRSG
jgi:SAM-dependent methyltransferase